MSHVLDLVRTAGRVLPFMALAAALAGCRSDGAGQIQAAWSFETDFDGWGIHALDVRQDTSGDSLEIPWSVTRTAARAARGRHSVEITFVNRTDAAKIWLERSFTVQPGTTYEWELRFAWYGIQSSQDGNRLLAGVVATPPVTREAVMALGVAGAGAPAAWQVRRATGRVLAGADGLITLVVGVWSTFEIDYAYGLDDVRVSLAPVAALP